MDLIESQQDRQTASKSNRVAASGKYDAIKTLM